MLKRGAWPWSPGHHLILSLILVALDVSELPEENAQYAYSSAVVDTLNWCCCQNK